MVVLETSLPGLLIIEPDLYADARGYFFESFNQDKWREKGITAHFVQDNESFSFRGVIRGLHYQLNPSAQAKLVRVVSGTVFDVAVDLRKDSPAFGRWFGTWLSGENKRQLLIPKGCAHGFSVLSETAHFVYKCDHPYAGSEERAIRYDDPFLAIDWKLPLQERIVSEKDAKAPLFADAEMNF